jgi:flavorubredoxin
MLSSAEARASLEVLERVDADVLVAGHGPVWTGGVAEAARRARDAVQG